jgi:hypothetical protein
MQPDRLLRFPSPGTADDEPARQREPKIGRMKRGRRAPRDQHPLKIISVSLCQPSARLKGTYAGTYDSRKIKLGQSPRNLDSAAMCDLARKIAIAVVLSAVLTQPSHAQQFPESERQKAAEARKKADEKATDEAYKSVMKHTSTTEKLDPWGGLRTPSANPGK